MVILARKTDFCSWVLVLSVKNPEAKRAFNRLYKKTLKTMIGMVGRMEVMDMFTIFNVLAWDESTLIKVWMFKRVTKTMIDRMVQVMGTLSVSLKIKWLKNF